MSSMKTEIYSKQNKSMKKYYILKRNNSQLMQDYLQDLSEINYKRCVKECNVNHGLLIIEKTCNKNHSETITNVWTAPEGVPNLWQKYTNGRLTYDYTGIVFPLIHLNGTVKLFRDHFYNEETKY